MLTWLLSDAITGVDVGLVMQRQNELEESEVLFAEAQALRRRKPRQRRRNSAVAGPSASALSPTEL